MANQPRSVNLDEAVELLGAGAFLLDVRNLDEFTAGHAPTAVHVALSDVPDHLDDLPRDRVIICACRSGSRSARATSFLQQNGFDAVNLEGGMITWNLEGQPLDADRGDATVN